MLDCRFLFRASIVEGEWTLRTQPPVNLYERLLSRTSNQAVVLALDWSRHASTVLLSKLSAMCDRELFTETCLMAHDIIGSSAKESTTWKRTGQVLNVCDTWYAIPVSHTMAGRKGRENAVVVAVRLR